jgi:hypothetical protein
MSYAEAAVPTKDRGEEGFITDYLQCRRKMGNP